MIEFYLGGVVATAVIMTAEAAAGDETIGAGECISALLWPVTIVLFALAVARGWKA